MDRDDALWREQTDRERELIETMLLADFAGRDEIATQLRGARVRDDCECGCGSFRVEPGDSRASVENGVAFDAAGMDDGGNEVGLFLMMRDGFVDYVECWGFTGVPFSLPLPSSLRLLTNVPTAPNVTHSVPHERTILEGDRRT
jgi:hypothetical protein